MFFASTLFVILFILESSVLINDSINTNSHTYENKTIEYPDGVCSSKYLVDTICSNIPKNLCFNNETSEFNFPGCSDRKISKADFSFNPCDPTIDDSCLFNGAYSTMTCYVKDTTMVWTYGAYGKANFGMYTNFDSITAGHDIDFRDIPCYKLHIQPVTSSVFNMIVVFIPTVVAVFIWRELLYHGQYVSTRNFILDGKWKFIGRITSEDKMRICHFADMVQAIIELAITIIITVMMRTYNIHSNTNNNSNLYTLIGLIISNVFNIIRILPSYIDLMITGINIKDVTPVKSSIPIATILTVNVGGHDVPTVMWDNNTHRECITIRKGVVLIIERTWDMLLKWSVPLMIVADLSTVGVAIVQTLY